MKPIGGRIQITVDGDLLSVRGSVTTNIGQGVVRETQSGVNGPEGFTEQKTVPFIQMDVTERPEFDLGKLNAVVDGTVNAELADGRTLVLRNATQVGDLEYNTDDGSVGSVRFEGKSGDQVAA